MMKTAAVILFAIVAAGPALADDASEPSAQQSAAEDTLLGMLTMKAGAEMSEADRGYMKAMQTMQQAVMKTEMSGNPGGDFARVMIPHHQSAIDMVDVLLAQKDIDPAMRALAEGMRADQAREIAALQAWLETHPQ